jgi:predicted MFS family arabinose efflux permease
MIAPIIGGTIAQYASYKALFVVASVMALCALLVTMRYIHNPHPEANPQATVGH